MLNATTINLYQSTINVSSVEIHSKTDIVIGTHSVITTSGNAPLLVNSSLGGGGGHAGYGAPACETKESLGGYPRGTLSHVRTFGGSGDCSDSNNQHIRGGGSIYIQAERSLVLYGSIFADGQSAPDSIKSACGGGAGGSISIITSQIMADSTTTQLSVVGGSGSNGGGGGSGGRIYLETYNSIELPMSTNGGAVAKPSSDPEACKFYLCNSSDFSACTKSQAATGIIYWRALSSTSKKLTLYCSYDNALTQTSGITITPISTDEFLEPLTHMYLTYCNAKVRSSLNAKVAYLRVRDLLQVSSAQLESDQPLFMIDSHTLTTATDSSIKGNQILVSSESISLDPSSSIILAESLSITSQYTTVSGSIMDADSVEEDTMIEISGLTFHLDRAAQMSADRIFIMAVAEAIIEGNLNAKSRPISNCSHEIMRYIGCDPTSPHRSDSPYSLSIFSSDFNVKQSANVYGSIILICTEYSQINGIVSSTGRGCAAMNGIGAGEAATQGASGGAGHGGIGGKGMLHGDSALGGMAYGSQGETFPSTGGSGGGGGSTSGAGGAGGGIVHIFSNSEMNISGRIEAAGGPGQNGNPGGGGGGSGGSIGLRTPRLQATKSAVVDISGGKGGSPGGGGGSGGEILIWWSDAGVQHIYRDDFHGKIVRTGGTGSEDGECGSKGIVASVPHCESGTFGIFCEKCKAGTFKDSWTKPLETDSCKDCPIGRYNDVNGSSTCYVCSRGTYTDVNGSTSCKSCNAGYYSNSGSSSCLLCSKGKFSQAGDSSCSNCAEGTFSSDKGQMACCTCKAGRSSYVGATSCYQCSNAPENSRYSVPGSCQFTCDVGFVTKKCETPFNVIIDYFHGPYFFSLALCIIGVTFALPFFTCWYRSKRRKDERLLEDKKAAGRLPRAGSEEHLGYYGREYVGLLSDYNESLRKSQNLYAIESPDSWLQQHLHRIYFVGTNNGAFGAQILSVIDDPVFSVVYPDRFLHFVRQMIVPMLTFKTNDISEIGRWTKCENIKYFCMQIVYLPLSVLWLESCRQRHISAIRREIEEYDYDCLRSHRAKALASSFRFGTSNCMSLVWIDVLAYPDEDCGFSVGKPTLPMVLVCAGDGTFFCPFHLDLTDPMVKCVSEFYGSKWFAVVASLNRLLRSVCSNTEECMRESMKEAEEYVYVLQRVGIGIGPRMPISGVKIHLAVLPPRCHEDIRRPAIVISSAVEFEEKGIKSIGLKKQSSNRNRTVDMVNDILMRENGESLRLCSSDLQATTSRCNARHKILDTILGIFLKRRASNKSKRLWALLLFVLLILEFVTNLVIVALVMQLNRKTFYAFILFFPFANFLSPICGLATLALSSFLLARIFTAFNMISVVNSLMLLTCGVFALFEEKQALLDAVIFPGCLIVTKILIGRVAVRYLSCIEYYHDMLLSRVDRMRDDHDDIHQEEDDEAFSDYDDMQAFL